MSGFGRQVIRLTNASTAAGSSFKCFYVDRSCLNLDNSKVMVYNGGFRLIPLHATTKVPLNSGYALDDTPGFPGGISAGYWSTTNPNEYWVANASTLFKFTAGLTAGTSSWTTIKNFTGLFTQGPCLSLGFFQLMAVRGAQNVFYFDNREGSKKTCGTLVYTLSTDTVQWMEAAATPGAPRNYYDTNPAFSQNKLYGVGINFVTQDNTYVGMQANICYPNPDPPNPPNPPENQAYCTGNPNVDVTTQTFAVPTTVPDYRYGGQSVTGPDSLNHGATTAKGQIHIANTSLYVGFLPSGSPNYMQGLLWIPDVTARPLDAQGKIPFVWLGGWPTSAGIGGIHLSKNHPTNDQYFVLSVYNEGPPRATGALANVISLVDTSGRLTASPNLNPATNITITGYGIIRHLTHHYSYPECLGPGANYNHQPQASVSLDNEWVVFTSSFGECGPGMRYDVFLVKVNP